jgi:hypothetical protein
MEYEHYKHHRTDSYLAAGIWATLIGIGILLIIGISRLDENTRVVKSVINKLDVEENYDPLSVPPGWKRK